MYGLKFFGRIIKVHGRLRPEGKIKDWQRVLVYCCDQLSCDGILLFWVDDMTDADHIRCRVHSCPGTMTLYDVPMEQALQCPAIRERIQLHTTNGS